MRGKVMSIFCLLDSPMLKSSPISHLVLWSSLKHVEIQ